MDELLAQLLIEGRELVQQASDDLLALERDPHDRQRLDSAFRAFHTLKGSVGIFDLVPMGNALHAGEDLLDAVRSGQLVLETGAINTLFRCLTQTEGWLAELEASGTLAQEAEQTGQALSHALRQHIEPSGYRALPAPSDADAQSGAERSWAVALVEAAEIAPEPGGEALPLLAIRYTPDADCFFKGDDPLGMARAIPQLVTLKVGPRDPWGDFNEMDPFSCNLRIDLLTRADLAAVEQIFRFHKEQVEILDMSHILLPGTAEGLRQAVGLPAQGSEPAFGSRILRVEAQRVDALVDIVGELIVAKNTLAHLTGQAADALGASRLRGILAQQANIDRLVAEMQRAVMDVRMVPLTQIFRRMPRLVREIAGRTEKNIAFATEGEEVEADKTIVDNLFEPLLHVLRNAIDHGIEPEAVRVAAGKDRQGTITMRAHRQADQIVIQISDDGRGIDLERVKATAIDRGILDKAKAAALTEAAVVDLIFAPGFSTASEITELSGRGVGMDSVRTAVTNLGGRISVSSRANHGTAVQLVLPLSIVMTKIMIVVANGQSYGVPIDIITETALVDRTVISPIGRYHAFVLHDRTLPLIALADLLNLPGGSGVGEYLKVLIVSCDGARIGVAVDMLRETVDVMVRPMTGLLAEMRGISGTTLLGSGDVMMILDIPALLA